jgi:hypothetical protein
MVAKDGMPFSSRKGHSDFRCQQGNSSALLGAPALPGTVPRLTGMASMFLFWGCRRIVFCVFLHHRDHFFHPFLDLTHLGMYFLDKVMLDPGQLFDSFALLAKLIQETILFDGKPAHPPKTYTPANGSGQGHPESEVVFIHFSQEPG